MLFSRPKENDYVSVAANVCNEAMKNRASTKVNREVKHNVYGKRQK